VEKLIGKKINIAVFISGKGSNLKSLIKYSNSKYSKIKIKLVISNKAKAKGLIYAKKSKIKFFVRNFKNVNISEKQIIKLLSKFKIDLICLAGFMRVISKKFIKKFKKPILNIHPSLLPKYKGLNTHKKVLKNNEKFSGATVHLITPKLDSGKIILQKKVRILKSDNVKTLKKKILKIEHKIYPKAILKLLSNL
tara:strand:+ start:352 stop:933 length:582 start_codon:yes stop_codon:yes gene_type:complete